jgi:nucleoside-diphosphate-sugar epimerase
MKRVLVTGANGFVGGKVCKMLQRYGFPVRGVVRKSASPFKGVGPKEMFPAGDVISVGDIDGSADWSRALQDIDTIIHLAARVHVLQEVSRNPLESFRSVNVHGTERLAHAAIRAGVRRFVYISSISIHGNSTGERAYMEEDQAHPHSPYAVSKWEGEVALRNAVAEQAMELVIVRPPLVYGAGVGGNFLRLMELAYKGLPLPLKSIENRRSFIGIENLAELIVCCVAHPRAARETFVASDGEDLSTPDLISRVARLMGRPVRLFRVPVGILRTCGRLMGKADMIDRLCNSLCVDASKARKLLGWNPRVSLDVGLEHTIRWYMDCYRGGGQK